MFSNWPGWFAMDLERKTALSCREPTAKHSTLRILFPIMSIFTGGADTSASARALHAKPRMEGEISRASARVFEKCEELLFVTRMIKDLDSGVWATKRRSRIFPWTSMAGLACSFFSHNSNYASPAATPVADLLAMAWLFGWHHRAFRPCRGKDSSFFHAALQTQSNAKTHKEEPTHQAEGNLILPSFVIEKPGEPRPQSAP
jgi:hypothetical protein